MIENEHLERDDTWLPLIGIVLSSAGHLSLIVYSDAIYTLWIGIKSDFREWGAADRKDMLLFKDGGDTFSL